MKDDLKKLEGTWHMVGCEEGGKVLAPKNVNPNDFLTMSGTTFHFKSGLRGLNGTFTIDPSKNPKWMDKTIKAGPGKLQVFKGIYELKGGKLRVYFGLPGGNRPSEFKTKVGEKLWLRTYERVKDKPARQPMPIVKQIADPAEVARMKKYYPQGFNFVDAIRMDGKIVWVNKLVVDDKVESKQWELATVSEFRKALQGAMIAKASEVDPKIWTGE